MSSGSFGTDDLYLAGGRFAVRGRERQHRQSRDAGGNRLRPQPAEALIPDFPIRGYEYYDYRHEVENTTFVNYQDNDLRKTGALSWLHVHQFGHEHREHHQGRDIHQRQAGLFPGDRPEVRQRQPGWQFVENPVDPRPRRHGRPASRSPTSMLHDGENNSVVTDDTCVIKPDWNASVCTGDVGRLFLAQRGGTLRDVRRARPSRLSATARNQDRWQPEQRARRHRDRVKTERPEVSLSVSEMDQGSWVIFELPGFTNAASGGAEQPGRIAQGERDFLFQGRGFPVGQTGGQRCGSSRPCRRAGWPAGGAGHDDSQPSGPDSAHHPDPRKSRRQVIDQCSRSTSERGAALTSMDAG